MEITDFEINKIKAGSKGNWIFLKVYTEEGLIGIGEASQSGEDELAIWTLKNKLLPELKGFNPLHERNKFFKKLKPEGIKPYQNFVFRTALSAVDQALFDLRSKAFKIPLNSYLGGRLKKEIPLYANINRALKKRSPADFAKKALKAVTQGYTAVKCAPFDGVSPYLKRSKWRKRVDKGFDRIKAIKGRIGKEKDLMIDCHGRFSSEDVLEIAKRLHKFDIYWLEDPVWTTRNLEGLRKIRKKTNMKIAGGENGNYKDLLNLMKEDLIDVIMPDIKHIGSITDLIGIARAAEHFSVGVAPHNPSGPVSTAFSAHLGSFIDNFIFLEFPFDEINWREEITEPEEPVKKGNYHLNEKPGIGISVNLENISS